MMTRETPAALGYRMPPEWYRHAATWLTWPKDPLTWPDRVPQAEAAYLDIMAALAPHERVNLLVDDEATEAAVRARLDFTHVENIHFIRLPTVDSWIRDYGPNFLINDNGGLAFNDWEFNAWGNKYGKLKQDNAIPAQLEPLLRVPRFVPGIVMEGGAIDVNGAGVVMTTEQCLLNPNRNPHLDRAELEDYLCGYLGAEKVLWLGEGIVGDDTDGHIDDIARFVSDNMIVCALEEDPTDANYKLLRDNFERLQHATDAYGWPYEIVTLPMPGIVGGRDDRLPASYANFYIANSVVLAPVFGHAHDQRAVETLQRLFKDRTVVPINAEALVWGMGTIHCLTQQQPAAQVLTVEG
ncbi:MAG: agmatine/peptidylarginine deiminase [Pyrinomonadaceae bacterium]